MNRDRFDWITGRYRTLKVGVLGDFCLDRYLEIDPARGETSIETGLPVHNVVWVRPQPGAAGTILNNLAALGVGTIYPIGFAGFDGEGFELIEQLKARPGVRLDHFLQTAARRTFTYCKPLVVEPGKLPVELSRLDFKNWSETPAEAQDQVCERLHRAAAELHALMVLDQVDLAETGVVTRRVRDLLGSLARERPGLVVLADSRRGLSGFPPIGFKMNAAELAAGFRGTGLGPAGESSDDLPAVCRTAEKLARRNDRPVFVTLAERGMVGATPDGTVEHVRALPLRGPIDIVGAGDAVSANLSAALGAGASLRESLELAAAAASVVIHKLGTTGTANVEELAALLFPG